MSGSFVRATLLGYVLAATVVAYVAPAATAQTPGAPTPGAASGDDPLFPGLGNGGYDVLHYDLGLVYESAAPAQSLPMRAAITARATQALSRLNLDYAGDAVSAVAIDGAPAGFVREGEELVVTPSVAIAEGARFTVDVSYTSGPRAVGAGSDFNDTLAIAWLAMPSGSVTAAQPNAAHRIFPSNDVPSDLATYKISAVTPATSTFVANGTLARRQRVGDRLVWTYRQRRPMASELIQLAFGALTVRDRGSDGSVLLRDVVPDSQVFALEPTLARTRDHLDWMVSKVGAYPFGRYGIVVSDQPLPFALETQTLSLFSATFLAPGLPASFSEPIMVHELAHQWFGDSVAPRRWSDVWQNEGHATWYEIEYAHERGFATDTLDEHYRELYAVGNSLRRTWGPVAAPIHGADDIGALFNPNVYEGGALVLYALRQEVGDPIFRAIERSWVHDHAGSSQSTLEFIANASRVAGRDLAPFLAAWLYGSTTPPMPGHPDWVSDPAATAPLSAARFARAAR